MRLPARHAAAAVIGIYNLIQNRLLPAGWYVPGNMVVSAGLVGLARRDGCSWDDLGLGKSRDGLAWSGAGAAGSAIVVWALSRIPASRRLFLDDRARGHDRRRKWYRAAVRFPLGTALFEEVAFRGVVYGMWRRAGASTLRASLASSALFGVWHIIPAHQTLVGAGSDTSPTRRAALVGAGVVASAVSGLGFVRMRIVSGNLAAPWATHAAFNSSSYLAATATWDAVDGRRGSNGVGSGGGARGPAAADGWGGGHR